MLSCYFDDSGTHTGGKSGPSKIVLVGGICGTEARLVGLEKAWQKHLDRPLCGRKDRLSRFHMAHCHESRGEFAGWSRTETDYFCHQLQDVIIDAGVGVYGVACVRQDYDELVPEDVRHFFGDAESYCITQCYVSALRWARETTFDPQITFVFDRRTPEIERRTRAVGDTFEKYTIIKPPPQIVGTAFLSSQAIRPLQAADLVAWEIYQHALQIHADGEIRPPKREALSRFQKSRLWLTTAIHQRNTIERMVEFVRNQNPAIVRAAGNHFTFFDPSNPDYSFLSGKEPD
jgi:hypothetical protein